jgi:hypothetical protein
MPFRLDRSPVYVVIFLSLLSAPQLSALVTQFTQGFRPFVSDPARVTLSWDMFSNRVERCVMEFERKMDSGTAIYLPMRGLGTRLEWDVIFDRHDDYRNAGMVLCRQGPGTTQVRLHCYLPDGTQTHEEFACE